MKRLVIILFLLSPVFIQARTLNEKEDFEKNTVAKVDAYNAEIDSLSLIFNLAKFCFSWEGSKQIILIL
jgi:hypothetical protein